MNSDSNTAIDMFTARHAPDEVFASPMDLATDHRLTIPQKLELLELWEGRAKRVREYSSEMPEDAKPELVKKIHDAIKRVNDAAENNTL